MVKAFCNSSKRTTGSATFLLLFCLLIKYPLYSQSLPAENKQIIVIIGDTQHIGFFERLYWKNWDEDNAAKTKSIFNEIASRQPAILLHLGDITSYGSSAEEWQNFDNDNQRVVESRIPVYPVFGNHEYFGDDTKMYNYFYKRFPLVKNKKWYSFTHAKTGFIMINTNFSDLSEQDTIAQRQWYQNQLRDMQTNDSITSIIVCGHHPPYTNSKTVNPSETVARDYANPFTRKPKALLFFSGHCHSYERFTKNGKIFIVSGGGGGPRQKLTIDPNKRRFTDGFNGPELRFFHFCELEIQNDSLVLSVIKLNENGTFSVAEKLKVR
ncbi:MAG: metallophosphoesterase [Ignavibacteriales bacterium]|nr:metallophosphoesterase [Ignavibacteriales bacterium]